MQGSVQAASLVVSGYCFRLTRNEPAGLKGCHVLLVRCPSASDHDDAILAELG